MHVNAATLLILFQLPVAVASIPAPSPPPPSYAFADTASLRTAVAAYNADAASATATYGPIASWGVSAITSMNGLFKGLKVFNADISSWDTSSVTDMGSMFRVRSAPAYTHPHSRCLPARCLQRPRFLRPSRPSPHVAPPPSFPILLCRVRRRSTSR